MCKGRVMVFKDGEGEVLSAPLPEGQTIAVPGMRADW